MTKTKEYLGEILVKQKVITQEELEYALEEQKKTTSLLEHTLIGLGFVTDEQVLSALSKQLNIPYIKIQSGSIDHSLVRKIPAKFVTHYNFMPIKYEKGVLVIAVSDPLDIHALDEIKLVLKMSVKPIIASREDIAKSIREYYGVGAETVERMVDEAVQELEVLIPKERKEENIEDDNIDPSVIKFVNQVFSQALEDRSTDIHFEPFEDEFRIRYRVDGILYETPIPPAIIHFQSAVVSRIKILAGLNIAEKRLPQDGKIQIRMGREEFDLRISILPTSFGESVSVRILSRSSMFLSLAELGMSKYDLDLVNQILETPHGIVLVTGPTGSGKTTTLYAFLEKLNSPKREIITIEDPIEYQLKGIIQTQVNPKIGLSFANGLRSILRHDPNIIMVGEIRDEETAELAIRAALTGHLIFSTLHTNDAAGAATRLLDMGIEPYLVSSSVICIIAQRLVRIICQNCKKEFTPKKELLREIGRDYNNVTFLRGEGCEDCKHTGYKGRTAIYEIFLISDEIRKLILNKSPSNIIREEAISQGMKSLFQDGWDKVEKGITTLEEVLRVTYRETSQNLVE